MTQENQDETADAGFDVIAIDGKNLLFRACHVFADLSVKIGGVEVPTGALYGFLTVLSGVYQRYGGTVIVCWESPRGAGESIRRDLYPDYKPWKHDDDSPHARQAIEVSNQIDPLQHVLSVAGIDQYRAVGYEADDVMATVAKAMASAGNRAGIYTADTDLLQCVGGGVRVIRPRNNKRGVETVYEPADVFDEFGVTPEQWPSYLALKGDTSDNIPGVHGVGKVTAVKLLKQFGSWKAIRDAAAADHADITASVKQKINDSAKAGDLSLELATIMDARLEIQLIEPTRDVQALKRMFVEMEFKSLLQPSVFMGITKMGG